ncbi:O-methylsterigmatocystin oxidoreductase [Mycena indigotica]|uniref:O-methylsterigmatocystin oxidoreductase n=1 Tax=Mycena indigotica TaxID=2126181 RepID=A0A8H6SK14_9AGAR|nr:O-methylsterigmatocystin oxidoreductase [Mycena indigotica]KAF7299260.1 O-methylsterigmatocystin oxidoreductase [Mycena indigotica]
METLPGLLLGFGVALIFVHCAKSALQKASNLPYPPGPRPLPILGNIRQAPASFPWLTYQEWARPIVHFQAFNNHTIIINSATVANDLLEKRSQIYSDRPQIPMTTMMGWDFALGFIPYGSRWRQYRRILHQYLRREASLDYRAIELKKIHDMLRLFLVSPTDFYAHIRSLAAAIIMSTVYNYDIKPTNDPFVDLAEASLQRLGASVFPGAMFVNLLPWLRHFPGWLPGFGFQAFCADTRVLTQRMTRDPYVYAQQNMLEGRDTSSMVAKILASGKAQGDSKIIAEVAGVAFAAGADTTVSAVTTFILAMATNPDIQRKAQVEIDNVVGSHRLPDFSDREELPYIEAVYREVLRWRPVSSFRFLRDCLLLTSLQGQSSMPNYKVITFLQGPRSFRIFGLLELVVVVDGDNTLFRAMCHDESIYPEPDKFKPERFLSDNGKVTSDPRMNIMAFGHGRRVCVGQHLADDSVWASIVSILSVFNIAKARDSSGKEIDIPGGYSDLLISHPEPFDCAITPRSSKTQTLIEDTANRDYSDTVRS